MKKIFLILFSFAYSVLLFSQGEIDTEHKILFRNEKSFALSLNSNGYGIGYRYGKRINAKKKILFEGDFNIVKHQKEKKRTNEYSLNLFTFVYGKKNSAFNTRIAIGRHHEIYKKFDRNSVSVRWFYLGGFSAIFLKPIYYEIKYDTTDVIITKTFDKDINWWYIVGKKPFYYGLEKISIIPGAYIKTGFSFEFSKKDKKLKMFEVGLTLDAYPKPVKIMETENNLMFFPVVYFSYRFGRVQSGYYLKEQDEGTYKP